MDRLTRALQFSLPVTITTAVMAIGHLALLSIFSFDAIDTTQVVVNYTLLGVLFIGSSIIVHVERDKGTAPFKKAIRKSGWQRLLLSLLFILFTSSSVPDPIGYSIHFLIPYVGLSVITMLQTRRLA